ncbi:hypothetical protein HNQ00_002878, partial [Flavobacterium sp. 14A]|nr:hypothetical protein [Flavobacterium sp. 14A]
FLYPEFILGSLRTLIQSDKGFLLCKMSRPEIEQLMDVNENLWGSKN